MPNIYALAAPEHLSLLVRGALALIVIFSVYNYLRSVYYGRIVRSISDRGATSPETAKSARELGFYGILGKFCMRRRSTLRKVVLTSEEVLDDGGEGSGSAEADQTEADRAGELDEKMDGGPAGAPDNSENPGTAERNNFAAEQDGADDAEVQSSSGTAEQVGSDNTELQSGSDDADEDRNEEAEAERLRKSDKLRPDVPFDKARFYIPESRLDGAVIRFCGSGFDRKGSPLTLAAGCVLIVVLGELFLHFYEPISDFLNGFMGSP